MQMQIMELQAAWVLLLNFSPLNYNSSIREKKQVMQYMLHVKHQPKCIAVVII